MKELKENLKSNLKFKFQKFGWPGDLPVKIDKSYHYTKQGKIFVLVTEIDTSFSLLLEPTLFFCEICKIMLSNMKNCELNCKHLIPNNRKITQINTLEYWSSSSIDFLSTTMFS